MGWNTLGDVVNAESVVLFFFGGVAMKTYDGYWVTSPSESGLQICNAHLKEIDYRIDKLTPRQREEIDVLARQAECKSIDELKRTHLR